MGARVGAGEAGGRGEGEGLLEVDEGGGDRGGEVRGRVDYDGDVG